MQNSITPSFIIIDDDPINNLICKKNIKSVFSDCDIKKFTDPQKGLDYICAKYDELSKHDTILFLDINMPVLNGWDVLDRLANCADVIKSQFSIFVLSSSIATEDKQRAHDNPIVKGFVVKPLTIQKLQKICNSDWYKDL